MDKSEIEVYIKQAIALFFIYIFCMILVIHFNPKEGKMTCDRDYECKVEIQYIWNIKRTGNFYVNNNVKMRFYNGSNFHSGFINLYEGGINLDPFGTTDFYPNKFSNWEELENIRRQEIQRFDNYIKNPTEEYVIIKEYNTLRLKLIGGIITVVFMALALTKRPVSTLLQIVFTLLTRGRY